jgi:hypothetical protein
VGHAGHVSDHVPWYFEVGRPFGGIKENWMVTLPDEAKSEPHQWVAVMSPATRDFFRVEESERTDFLGLGAAIGRLTGIEVIVSEAVPYREVLFLPKALVDELRGRT